MKKQNFTNKNSAFNKIDAVKSDSVKIDATKSNSAGKSTADSISITLLPYFLCALLCMFLLCGTTWAWFTSSVSGETASIKSADYKIVITAEANGSEVPVTDNKLLAEANTEYTVTLSASGAASTGFCTMVYSDPVGESGTIAQKKLYSQQIASGSSIMFVIRLTYSAEISFGAQWGTSSRADSPDVVNGFVITD